MALHVHPPLVELRVHPPLVVLRVHPPLVVVVNTLRTHPALRSQLSQGSNKWVLGLLGFTLAALVVSVARAEAAFAMLVEASHRLHDTMLGEPDHL